MKNDINILHMASFSRSGETLLLRCLNAHSDLQVTHNLYEKDTQKEIKLFQFLKNYKDTYIPNNHIVVEKTNIKKKNLILKNATWTHKYPFNGFILVRNPLSIANSLNFNSSKFSIRFNRFCEGIYEDLLPCMNDDMTDRVTQFSILWNIKMGALLDLGLPIVRYEDFVENPEKTLKSLFQQLDIPWDDIVLKSHESYTENEFGHGGIPLWKPIHKGSLHKYKELPPEVLHKVYAITYTTMKAYGYDLQNGELVIKPLSK